MRQLLLLLLAIMLSASTLSAQTNPLPPSLQKELRLRTGKAPRVVSFSDTIKAQTLISRSLRDTSGVELDSSTVMDSAVVVMDSAVSLSHKQLIDSLLAELPEYLPSASRGSFNYPTEILVETKQASVSFDTTLLGKIEPISREYSSFFDPMPLSQPLTTPKESPFFILDAGVGAPVVPKLYAEWLMLSNRDAIASLFGKYNSYVGDASALRSLFTFGAHGEFLFTADEIALNKPHPFLSLDIRAGALSRMLITPQDSSAHSLASILFDSRFSVGESKQLRMTADVDLSHTTDETFGSSSELSGSIAAQLDKLISDSKQIELTLGYSGAGAITNSPLSLGSLKGILHHINASPIDWQLGFALFLTSDAHASRTVFAPQFRLTYHSSDALRIGAAYEPSARAVTLRELTRTNLFYSDSLARSVTRIDSRSIVTDDVSIKGFVSYFLSSNDYIRGELRFITRTNDVFFERSTDSLSQRNFFTTKRGDVRRFEAEFGSRLVVFTRDELNTSIRYISATEKGADRALPYEPSFAANISYTFRSISEDLSPEAEFIALGRKDRTLTFLNLGLRYPLSSSAVLKICAENIFGGAGDFWDGYNEYPRSILVSIRAAF